MKVARAKKENMDGIMDLLSQVLEVHAKIRPDIFISGKTKYTEEELVNMIEDDDNPIFVAVDDENKVLGYAFCNILDNEGTNCIKASRELYIDDLCVDENSRGKNVANVIFSYVRGQAALLECDSLTLNVWSGNKAATRFYEKMGLIPRKTMMEMKID